MSDFSIIENTDEARAEYGYAYGAECFTISKEELEALNTGKCLATGINAGEYVAFITLEKEVLKKLEIRTWRDCYIVGNGKVGGLKNE